MNKLNNNGICLLLIVTLLIAISLSMGGHVICVGFDGHVAIEAGGWQGICVEDKVAHPSPHTMSASTHCGTCLDYKIAIDHAPRVAESILVTDVPIRNDTSSIFAPVPPRPLSVAAPTLRIPPSRLAQNVVLLI